MKVIELSKELGITVPKLKATLDELGIRVRAVTSKLKDADAVRVAEKLGQGAKIQALLEVAAPAAEAAPAPAAAPAAAEAKPAVRKISKAALAGKAGARAGEELAAPAARRVAAAPKAAAKPPAAPKPRAAPKVSKIVAPLLRATAEHRPQQVGEGVIKPQVRVRIPPRRLPTIRRRPRVRAKPDKEAAKPKPSRQPVTVSTPMSVREFAVLAQTEPARVLGALLDMGIVASLNKVVEPALLARVGPQVGREVQVEEPTEEALATAAARMPAENLVPRPPVVTVLGHVDHGKTTLLDAIRNTRVTAQEVGGITQHIGAYSVQINERGITFIDTPGHEAFTAMRARGANVTDVAVLVVAADDGVMPQTIEAINHARAAGVPIVVAVNKIDRPQANPERVRQQLVEQGLTPEEWGGETVFVDMSALNGTGIQQLLEMILLVADMQELKADPTAPATATVIEAELDRRVGPLVTALVRSGTLRVGDAVVAGQAGGKVRAMVNDRGEAVEQAGPAMPVVVMGFDTVPQAGDLLEVVGDERAAKQVVSSRQEQRRADRMQIGERLSLEDLYQRIQRGEVKELNVILKADVQGSVEALSDSLVGLEHPEVRVRVLHAGVGDISDSDVMLAQASQAIIIGFHVNIESAARELAQEQGVSVRIYQVIYDLLDDVKAAMAGMLAPEYETTLTGRAEVRALFKISRVGTVAGCYVTEGALQRGTDVRVVREGDVIHQGKLDSLRHLKDDVREIEAGFECGIAIEGFDDFEPGDVIEAFTTREVRREVV